MIPRGADAAKQTRMGPVPILQGPPEFGANINHETDKNNRTAVNRARFGDIYMCIDYGMEEALFPLEKPKIQTEIELACFRALPPSYSQTQHTLLRSNLLR